MNDLTLARANKTKLAALSEGEAETLAKTVHSSLDTAYRDFIFLTRKRGFFNTKL